ncbi:MAG TPA: hypothetical protein VFV38_47415 [Ktedonobacteraceae bacterium]|nr:hypothetical protein [Ktedonobacteraceae bacterium]
MHRVLEAIFRHPFRLLIMLVLPPLIGVAIAYVFIPRSYQAISGLWAFERFGVITATGLDSNAYATPAETQATALTELLNSRSFVLSVVNGIDILPTLHLSNDVASDPQKRDDAIFAEISKNVTVTPVDYNLYTISYKNSDPQIAQKIVASVINQFSLQGIQFTYAQAQRLLQVYEQQLLQAKNQATQAVTAEQQYLHDHPDLTKPGISPLNDPAYASLEQQRLQAQSSVQNLETSLSILNQEISVQGTSSGSFFKELDSPLTPNKPQTRTRQFLVGGGVGLGVGLLACIIVLLVMVRRDRAIYIPRDIDKLADVPVVMELPHLPARSMQRLVERSA